MTSYFCNKCGYVGDTGPEHTRRGSEKQCNYSAGKVEPTTAKKTPGEIACDAFAAHLISVPLGGVICGGGLSAAWSQYSELGKAAWEATADAIRTAAIEEVEHQLSSEIRGITLGPALEGKITEQEALALVNASRQCLLAGVRSLKSPEKPA